MMCRLRDLTYETELKLDLVYRKFHYETVNGVQEKKVDIERKI